MAGKPHRTHAVASPLSRLQLGPLRHHRTAQLRNDRFGVCLFLAVDRILHDPGPANRFMLRGIFSGMLNLTQQGRAMRRKRFSEERSAVALSVVGRFQTEGDVFVLAFNAASVWGWRCERAAWRCVRRPIGLKNRRLPEISGLKLQGWNFLGRTSLKLYSPK